jgi:hypothetical protein
MTHSNPYDETVTEQQREVQEALMNMPGIGNVLDEAAAEAEASEDME